MGLKEKRKRVKITTFDKNLKRELEYVYLEKDVDTAVEELKEEFRRRIEHKALDGFEISLSVEDANDIIDKIFGNLGE